MAIYTTKHVKSVYRYIRGISYDNGTVVKWQVRIAKACSGLFDSEIEAAKAADVVLIKMGKDPVNILKRK